MKQPRVSVVMPVYNVQQYLQQSLDSLLAQTMAGFEVICVDDGSTDRSLEILRGYEQRDSRFTVLQQANGGGGAARNLGMAAARGEYIIFLDSDDFFDPRLLELTCQRGDETGADMVIFAGKRFDQLSHSLQDTVAFLRTSVLPEQTVFSRNDIPENILQVVIPAPWTRLYRRSFLERIGLRYQELANSNDYYFGLCTLALADQISALREPLVFYRINNPSSIQGKSRRDTTCMIKAIRGIYDELKRRGILETVFPSLVHAATDSLVFTLRTVTRHADRFTLLDLLQSEDFQSMDMLGHEESWYKNRTVYQYASTIQAALAQYEKTKRAALPPAEELVHPAAAAGEVLVSVIVPVYNTSFYLEDTLKSLTEQTLREIEIICVDDGSTDDSLSRLLRWAEQDGRISVFHQENRGLSVSRNVGLSHARGTYVYFMDSDDLLEPDALECLTRRMEAEALDVVFFNALTFQDADEPQSGFAPQYQRFGSYDGVWTGAELFYAFEGRNEFYSSACLQLLRVSWLRDIGLLFHPGIIHEDQAFTFEVMLRARRAGYLNRPFFHRRIRGNSIMTTSTSFANSYGYFVAFCDMSRCIARVEGQLNPAQHESALVYLARILTNARNNYQHMPSEDQGSQYGLGEDYKIFEIISRDWSVAMQHPHTVQQLQQQRADRRALNAKLKATYAEKSEINAKLQRTYKEKAERGIQIKELKAELAQLRRQNQRLTEQNEQQAKALKDRKAELKQRKAELKRLKQSASYKLGRILTWPVRKLRRLLRKQQ